MWLGIRTSERLRAFLLFLIFFLFMLANIMKLKGNTGLL